jgi:hypothetical protein
LILGDRALISDEGFEFCDLRLILLLESLNILFRYLNIRLELKNVDKELSLVGQLLLIVIDHI